MARTSEEELRVLSRRAKVAAMIARGTTNQYEIAERLGLDRGAGQRMVSRDVQAIEKAWRESSVRDLGEDRGRELDKLCEVEQEFWAAWERSKAERTSSRSRRRTRPPAGKGVPAASEDEAELKREQRDGDPRFLAGVLDCVRKRCELLGLDAARRHEHAGPGGGAIPITMVEIVVPPLPAAESETETGEGG